MNYFRYILLLALCSFACSTEYCLTDTQNCINALVDWCSQQDYTNAVYSYWTVTETIGYETEYLECVTYTNGTICYENGSPWFECTPDNIASYKGVELGTDSPNGGDDEICYAASRITTISWNVEDDDQCCLNDLVEWCNEQDYSMVLCPSEWTFYEWINGQHYYIDCQTDNTGTTCDLNGSFLFQCSADHTATYKDVVLCENSPNGADCEICYISSKITSIDLTVPTCCPQ